MLLSRNYNVVGSSPQHGWGEYLSWLQSLVGFNRNHGVDFPCISSDVQ